MWSPKFPRREAVEAFRDWATKSKPFGVSEFTGSEQKFWAEIHTVIPIAKTSTKDSASTRHVTIDLADLRSNFEKYFRGQPI
jgi:hypothetical protein